MTSTFLTFHPKQWLWLVFKLIWFTICLSGCSGILKQLPTQEIISSDSSKISAPGTPPNEFSLNAAVFFDFNGNGSWDANEPPLPDVILEGSGVQCISASDGTCSFGNVHRGLYTLNIFAPTNFAFTIHPTGKVYNITDGVSALVETNTDISVALTEGIFTQPFKGQIKIDRFYDHAPGDTITWWNEPNHQCLPSDIYCTQQPIGTDKHSGTDFILLENTTVLAAAPGNVIGVSGPELCSSIVIYHGYFRDHHILSGYTHLSHIDVKLGDRVRRGSAIGIVGDTCTQGYTHLHFDVFSLAQLNNPQDMDMLDPYQALVPVADGFWQRKLGSLSPPVWIPEFSAVNLSGWWTVTNQPQYPN